MLLVSDYDGTIKKFYNKPTIRQKYDFIKEIKAINRFVKNGNDFAISTMRKTPSIKHEIEEFKILYTYLTTFNGMVTFDNKDRIVNAHYFNKDYIKYILDTIDIGSKNIISMYNEYGESDIMENIVLIGIKTLIPHIILEKLSKLKMSYEYNRNTLWLHDDIDKSIAIEDIIKDKQISNVFTIGDSQQDEKMIRYHNGHCINNSFLDNELDNSIPRVKNVRTLIKRIK